MQIFHDVVYKRITARFRVCWPFWLRLSLAFLTFGRPSGGGPGGVLLVYLAGVFFLMCVVMGVFWVPWERLSGRSPEAAILRWERSEASHRYGLCMRLQRFLPLYRVVLLASHNSFNSRAYNKGIRYLDPNQHLSLLAQLRMGVRMLEFDVHFFSGELRLSHALWTHSGVWPLDLPFREGLREVGTYLREYVLEEDYVLFIYIEDHMDGHYDLAIDALERELGAYVYHPQGIPIDYLTMELVLQSGSSIVLLTDGYGRCSPQWCSYVHRVLWKRSPRVREERGYGGSPPYFYRVYEDRTLLARVSGRGLPHVSALSVANLSSTGEVNVISLDHVVPDDPRFLAFSPSVCV